MHVDPDDGEKRIDNRQLRQAKLRAEERNGADHEHHCRLCRPDSEAIGSAGKSEGGCDQRQRPVTSRDANQKAIAKIAPTKTALTHEIALSGTRYAAICHSHSPLIHGICAAASVNGS